MPTKLIIAPIINNITLWIVTSSQDNTDDLEFWLSTSDVKTTENKVSHTQCVLHYLLEQEEKEEVPSASPATVKSKGKKEKKSKGEKRTKSSKKSSKTVQVEEEMPTGGQGVLELLGFELEAAPTSEEPMTSFKVLSEDENLKMVIMSETQTHIQYMYMYQIYKPVCIQNCNDNCYIYVCMYMYDLNYGT